jgi:glycosyltransferase involved in cell wall biosynthesis
MEGQNNAQNFKKEPKISVMLLTYNRAKLVPRAIKSVLSQTFKDFELVIVNNAAEDNTEEVIGPLLKDPRVVYKKLDKNIGPFGGINEILDMVSGRYIINMADDDELLPDALQTISENFDRLAPKGVKILWFDCIDAESGKYSGSGIRKEGYISYEDYLCNRFQGDYQVVMDRVGAIGNNRFDPNYWGGMTTVFNLMCHKNNKAYYIPKVIEKLYREHGESRISMPETSLLNHIPKIILTINSFLKKYGDETKKLCPKCYGQRLASLGFYQILNGDKKEGRNNILKSLGFHFSIIHFFVFIFSFIFNKKQIKIFYTIVLKIKKMTIFFYRLF